MLGVIRGHVDKKIDTALCRGALRSRLDRIDKPALSHQKMRLIHCLSHRDQALSIPCPKNY